MIRATNLTRKYGVFTAVDSISFEIPRGQIVGLLGHNGAGKTTTLKMLTGYLEPTEGDVEIAGMNILKDPIAVQKKIGYLSEQSPLYPDMTVWQYLYYVAEMRGVPPPQIGEVVREAIRATDLGKKAEDLITTLSRGYQQRVGVAQAILHKPEILILDEPTNGLDPTQIMAMRQLIKNLSRNATVILSTHILQEVEAICDRVIIILNGRIAVDSSLKELRQENSIKVSLKEDVSSVKTILESVTGVSSVSPLATSGNLNHFSVKITDQFENIAPAIAKTVVNKGWNLYSMENEHRDLEAIFNEVNRVSKGVAHV